MDKKYDLISRSAVLKAIAHHTVRDSMKVLNCERLWAYEWTKSDMFKIVQNAPALDAVPVVHAKWIYTGEMDEDGNCEANCSHCGAGDKHRADLKDSVPYCWKCGARMDGEVE